ncbi:MAG TPA: ribosome recycling factor [Thiobacillaceae bacterium]|nr:ribosome recycling factor [Thiobacillaceae bacterium]HNU64974.1 ribosome recycling factor [Thiobacillaceae bacterium]
MIADIKKTAEDKMRKSVEALRVEFTKVRTGRAHAGLLDHVKVDYYGSMMPISQVANISIIDSHTLGVQPWEKKMAAAIEKAIRDSDLGLNPASMGELVRVPIPAMTEERRRELVKVVRGEAEGGKVAVRNIRRDALGHLKELLKNHEIGEDEERRAGEDMQKLTDRYIAEIDRYLAEKEKDLMAV